MPRRSLLCLLCLLLFSRQRVTIQLCQIYVPPTKKKKKSKKKNHPHKQKETGLLFILLWKSLRIIFLHIKDRNIFKPCQSSGLLKMLLKFQISIYFEGRTTYFYKHFYYSGKFIPQDTQNLKYPGFRTTTFWLYGSYSFKFLLQYTPPKIIYTKKKKKILNNKETFLIKGLPKPANMK